MLSKISSSIAKNSNKLFLRSLAIYSRPDFKPKYNNFINGEFVPPVHGKYHDVISPIDGNAFTKAPLSSSVDLENALDAANEAFKTWSKTSVTERSIILNKIADRIEQNLEYLATVETVDNGKPIRETLAADLPLVIDHFRYFASVIRAEEGSISELDSNTVSIIIKEPLGVVGQIIPWNFPLLMAAWKVAPAIAAGNCVVLKPAEFTPISILVLLEIIGDLLPKGVLNVVSGEGKEVGAALASSTRIQKIAFTGSTATGSSILKASAENIIPATMELGGKSPMIFMPSILDKDDEFLDKVLEGAAFFALNQGEICTCPSRLLVHEDIADKFIPMIIDRVQKIKRGHPLDSETMIGAQVSKSQFDKINNYIKIGKEEGAQVITGGSHSLPSSHPNYDELKAGFFIEPTILKGTNDMRVFKEEIFGPVASLTTFKNIDEAISIANDTEFGLGAGVWTRDAHEAYQLPRAIQAGRVWVNCYHHYPSHAPFGGYKKSGFGRETHKMMLDHYRATKNMLVSYSKSPLGFY